MAAEEVRCALCGGSASRSTAPEAHNCYSYSCRGCSGYHIWHHDKNVFLDNHALSQEEARHIRILLCEWHLKNEGSPVLQFTPASYPEIANAVPLRVTELLAMWPESIPERIERCLCNVIRYRPCAVAGEVITIRRDPGSQRLFFTENKVEEEFFVTAMIDYRWVEEKTSYGQERKLCVRPMGWAKYDALTRGEGDAKNPAFVAMWFGGADRKDEMQELFDEAIQPAINNAGYRAERADSEEHNESIIDKIVAKIRVAPFVVAELTTNSPGVYYEAGLARGRGIEVIYCYPDHADKKPHFDVSGLNQLRWKDPANLKVSLENRILGTLRRGPYSFDEEKNL